MTPQHKQAAPPYCLLKEGAQVLMDGLLDRRITDEPAVAEFLFPPGRARPYEMAVYRPALVVARPMPPIRSVADAQPFPKIGLLEDPKNAISAPHRSIQIDISIAIHQRQKLVDIVVEPQWADVLENVHAENDVKAAIDLQSEKIAKHHRIANVWKGQCKREMAHLSPDNAEAGICQEAHNRAGKAPQLKAAASPQSTHDRGRYFLVAIDNRAPYAKPIVIAMSVDQRNHPRNIGVAARDIDRHRHTGDRLRFVAIRVRGLEIGQRGHRDDTLEGACAKLGRGDEAANDPLERLSGAQEGQIIPETGGIGLSPEDPVVESRD